MEDQKINLSNVVKHFSPAWFAAVMGTGGTANVLFALSGSMHFLKPVSIGLWWLNILLFILFIGPWTARWFIHFDKLKDDLKHPVISNFFVTMPVGGIILGTNFFIMGKNYFSMHFIIGLGMIFWTFGVLTALAFGVYVIFNMMITDNIGPESTNFAWFITPVASIVIPLLGNMLVSAFVNNNKGLAELINIIDICFFGIGFLLFLILSSILIGRFINYKMPHSMAVPTFWIILGPVGVGTVSLLGIADASKALGLISDIGSLKLLALILWGFGLWAFILTIAVTLKYMKNEKIPFSLSWWAFIFPMAAYTLSGLNVYQYTGIQLFRIYSLILALLLMFLWIVTFIKSLAGTLNCRLLIPQMNQQGNMKK